MMDDLEEFWSLLLSEDDSQIRKAWTGLQKDEAAAVRAHLERMAADEDYSAAQRQAARAALRCINSAAP
jgi:hypothetical protein